MIVTNRFIQSSALASSRGVPCVDAGTLDDRQGAPRTGTGGDDHE